MTTNTTSTASQAPAVSIDTPEFRVMMKEIMLKAIQTSYTNNDSDFVSLAKAEKILIAHINDNLAQAREEGRKERDEFARAQQVANGGLSAFVDHYQARATAAEAKLEAIRQGVEGLARYEHWDAWGASGTSKAADGDYVKRDDVLALLQPQPQADESGLPG